MCVRVERHHQRVAPNDQFNFDRNVNMRGVVDVVVERARSPFTLLMSFPRSRSPASRTGTHIRRTVYIVRAPDREIFAHICEAHMCWREWRDGVCVSDSLLSQRSLTHTLSTHTPRVKYIWTKRHATTSTSKKNKQETSIQDGHVWGDKIHGHQSPVSMCIIVLS